MRAVEVDFRQEWTHDDEPGLTGTQGVTRLYGIDLRHTRIAHPTPLVSLPPPHVHLYTTIGHLLRLIGTILPVLQSLLSSLCAGKLTPTSAPTLVRVAVARGRVLCPECHGENDDMFHFCQWCATTPSTCYSISAKEACLSIDEAALGARYTQFTTSLENKTSGRPPRPSWGSFSRHEPTAAPLVWRLPSRGISYSFWADWTPAATEDAQSYTPCTVHR